MHTTAAKIKKNNAYNLVVLKIRKRRKIYLCEGEAHWLNKTNVNKIQGVANWLFTRIEHVIRFVQEQVHSICI